VPARVWHRALEGLLAAEPPLDTGRISAPTLIVWGARDGLLPRSEQEQMVAEIPGAAGDLLRRWPPARHRGTQTGRRRAHRAFRHDRKVDAARATAVRARILTAGDPTRSAVEYRPADVVAQPLVVKYELADRLWELVALPPAFASPGAHSPCLRRAGTCGLDRITSDGKPPASPASRARVGRVSTFASTITDTRTRRVRVRAWRRASRTPVRRASATAGRREELPQPPACAC
jgi:hypothetical protein